MFFKKNEKELIDFREIVLDITSIVSLIISIYAALTEGQTYVHSDSATAIKLVDSIIKNQSLFPKSWAYNNGEIWLLSTHLFAFIPNAIYSNASFARAMTSTLIILCFVVMLYVYLKKGVSSKAYLLIIPVVLVFMQRDNRFIIYEACYTVLLIWLILQLFLFSRLVEGVFENQKLSIPYLISFSIIQALICVGGIRWFSEITIPFIGGLILLLIYDNEKHIEKGNWLIIGSVIFSSIIGIIFYKSISSTHIINNSHNNVMLFSETLEACWKNVGTYIQSLYACFTFEGGVKLFSLQGVANAVGMVMATIICFVVPFLQITKLRQESIAVKLLFFITVVHNAIMLMIEIMCGIIDEEYDERYLLSSVFLLIVLSCRYIYSYWIQGKEFDGHVWSVLFFVVTVIMSINLLTSTTDWHKKLESEKNFAEELVSRGLTKGYASYWNAYETEMYSDKKLRIGGIKVRDSRIHRWNVLVDDSIFDEEKCDTFLILTEEEVQNLGDRLAIDYGVPIDEFVVEKVYSFDGKKHQYQDYYIFVYDYDIIQNMDDNILDGELTAKDMYFNEYGSRQGKGFLLTPGGIVHGPYCHVERGKYKFTFKGDNISKASCSISSENFPSGLAYSVIDLGKDFIVMDVKITEDIDDFQVYIINYTENETVSWDNVVVERL